jgi:hypothetical protein
MKIARSLAGYLLILAVVPFSASGQQEADDIRSGALNVFLECGTHRGCESSHFRTEITFVNWVRDLQDSQLHVIMNSEGTGGGDLFSLDFMGRGDLEGNDDRLTYSYSDTDSDDSRTQGLTGVLAIGVARYALLVGQEGPFLVNSAAEEEGGPRMDLPPGLQGEVDDPWDYWVFSVGGSVKYEDEDLKDENSYSANFSANRITELWKISFTGRGAYTDTEGQYSSGTAYQDVREEGSVNARVFYSLADRWSVGAEAGSATSTRNNQDLSGTVGGGVEYSFFPYRDWTRKRMTAQALIYGRYFDYEVETQFNKMSETLAEGALKWSLSFRQPWGTASVNASAEAYLHNPSELYRLSAGGNLSFRITRGLNWNLSGTVSRIRDQIFIPLEDLSDEDILLGRRQLPTDSQLCIATGFSFTFGSIFNNVVNNRFGFSGGSGFGGGGSRCGRGGGY